MTHPILITGASRGLGAALAQVLAPKAHIIAVAKTVGALEDVDDAVKAAGGQTTLAPMDVTTPDAMRHLCRSIHDRWGGLSMWLHTAIHAAPLSPAHHIGEKDFAKSVSVNVTATAHLIQMVAPLLGQTGQAIFFEDAVAGEKFFGSYGATKAAQIALARSWQVETQKTGPRVHIVTPAAMPTATRARFHPGEDRTPLTQPMDEARRLMADLSVI